MRRASAIPGDRHAVTRRAPVPRKVRLPLRADADVEAFFRTLNPGHRTPPNAVPRAFMPARQAEVVKGAEAAGYAMTGDGCLRDATDKPFAPGAREGRNAYLKKRMRELGVE